MPRVQPNFLETIIHETRAFLSSFTHDYTGITGIRELGDDVSESQEVGEDTIKVWIGLGRDQAQVLKQMIEDTFTPETGIPVVLELITSMGGLLVPATIAGTAPDVALGAANIDLAYRGAVTDVGQFEDFEEVSKRFMPSALVNFRFRDQVWALPEIQSFPMLFYRKDVLAELGLEVPETWKEVYAIIPELQKKHLEFGILPNMGTFEMFLYQKGVALYKEDMVEANLESEAAIATFEEMTDLYTLYGLPLQYDFINRFRMGEMPLAIVNYGEFNTLSVFAPELRGEWGMAPVPGTVMEDGTINRCLAVHQTVFQFAGVSALAASGGPTGRLTGFIPHGTTGTMIMAGSEKQEQAWEFLKWWTRADTQVRFGREMEALMGAAARYATANVEAMQQLPWSDDELSALNAQWQWVEGVPPVLGGYYVTRQFDWLFRAVVLHNEPIRESVLDYSREINKEIGRKREEFSFETDVDKVDQEWKDMYWGHYTHLYRLDWERTEEEEQKYLELLRELEEGLGLSLGS